MSTCECFKGTPAGYYKPEGSYQVIGGLTTYRCTSTIDTKKRQNILFLPDGFGLATHNIRLADMYAAEGFDTTVVDYFEGNALPDCFMKYIPGTNVDEYDSLTIEEKNIIRKIDMPSWQARHDPDRIASLLYKFLPRYHDIALGTHHVVGHCFGGKSAFTLARAADIASVVIFHPAFLETSDLKDLKAPVFLGCAETDIFTPTLTTDMLSSLPRAGCAYKLVVYGGTKHGFSSRPDPTNPEGEKVFKEAFDDSLEWLRQARP